MPQIDLGSVVGPRGEQGATGPQGEQGIQGIQGVPGKDATINGANALTLSVGGAAHLTQEDGTARITAVGKNLLVDAYFTNPVNQRGKTEYADAGYTIDRWRISSGVTLVINDDGTITVTNNSDSEKRLWQTIEQQLLSTEHTLSVLATEVTGTVKAWLQETMGAFDTPINGFPVKAGITTRSGTPVSKNRYHALITLSSGASVTLQAVKLELGSQQTLAHQDANGKWELNEIPDYGEELAKCQRYFERVYLPAGFTIPARGENNLYANLFFKAEKRATPTGIGYPMYVVKASNNTGVYGAFVNAVPDLTRISKDVCSVRFLDTQVNSIPLGETAYLSTNTGAVLYFDVDAEL